MDENTAVDLQTIETRWTLRQILDMNELLDIKDTAFLEYQQSINPKGK